MQRVAVTYFGIVGIFVTSGLVAQATGSSAQPFRTGGAAPAMVRPQAAVFPDCGVEWQRRLDALHW